MTGGAPGSQPAATRFRFGPRDRRGLIAGLGGAQLVAVAGGLAVALAAVRAVPGGSGLAVSLLAALVGLLVALVPAGGRPLVQWLPTMARFAVGRLGERPALVRSPSSPSSSSSSFSSSSSASRRPAGLRRPPAAVVKRRPRLFADFSLVELNGAADDPVGAVFDRRHARWTAVLPLGMEAFGLLDAGERARRVAGWSGLLAALAGQDGAVDRLAWIERTVPDRGEWLHHPPGLAPAAVTASYEDLLAVECSTMLRHELLLACSVRAGTSGLAGELERLRAQCLAAGVAAGAPLPAERLAGVLRSSIAASAVAAAGAAKAAPCRWPWAAGAAESWGELRTDDVTHASYWIAEWPRSAVGDDFLLPLLLGSWVRRSVSLVMAPRPIGRAARAVEQERTAQAADAELRRRHGFAPTARLQHERAAVEQREQELAAGHAAYRFSGYVTVSAPDRDTLASSCASVERAATLAHLDLRRLFGCQAEAFACTLPTGRGCA